MVGFLQVPKGPIMDPFNCLQDMKRKKGKPNWEKISLYQLVVEGTMHSLHPTHRTDWRLQFFTGKWQRYFLCPLCWKMKMMKAFDFTPFQKLVSSRELASTARARSHGHPDDGNNSID